MNILTDMEKAPQLLSPSTRGGRIKIQISRSSRIN